MSHWNLKIDSRKKVGNSNLFLRVQRWNRDISFNTHVEVDVEKWKVIDASDRRFDNWTRTVAGDKVTRIRAAVMKMLDDAGCYEKLDRGALTRVINEIAFEESIEAERTVREQQMEAEAIRQELMRNDVLGWISERCGYIISGAVHGKGGAYSKATRMNWKLWLKLFTEYYNEHPFTWRSWSARNVDEYISWLEERGNMPQSINNFLHKYKSIVAAAVREELVTASATGDFARKSLRLSSDAKKQQIYLTQEELDALWEMKLEGHKSRMRDIFLAGCYTCQRVSDYSRINKDSFGVTARGTRVIRLVQLKTDNQVVIPILDNRLELIMERNNWNLLADGFSLTVFNDEMKDIFKELSKEVPSLATMVKTRVCLQELRKTDKCREGYTIDQDGNYWKPRYEMVSSHTARRSGITNLYLTGRYNTLQMMAISGHKTESIFYEYIRLSGDDIADEIAKRAADADL